LRWMFDAKSFFDFFFLRKRIYGLGFCNDLVDLYFARTTSFLAQLRRTIHGKNSLIRNTIRNATRFVYVYNELNDDNDFMRMDGYGWMEGGFVFSEWMDMELAGWT